MKGKVEELLERLNNQSTYGLPSLEDIEMDDDDDEIGGENSSYTPYKLGSETFTLSFIEFAILNEYLFNTFRKNSDEMIISNYGSTDSVGRISYGGPYSMTNPWWFQGKFSNIENEFFFQTKMYLDNRRDIITEMNISVKESITTDEFTEIFKRLKKLAFNNSKYVGKCIKVKLRENSFKGIEIIDLANFKTELILTPTQEQFLEHFISRVSRGSSARYLFNGEPGTGKTETIREIVRRLTPNTTFIIPDFTTTEDLTSILEACEIFNNSVIIMDDIDLFLGSRDKGNYTVLLGQFLAFFDGVKKRKISLLASTNDKNLVDKAAERPGRFNMTLDYTFLTPEQIVKVCDIHLPEKYRIKDVYDVLSGTIQGKKANITGAFIANLADNIKEMSEDNANWELKDTISLITESYKGFYLSQVQKNNTIGFKIE
jgi:hypothetical protein